MEVLENPMKSSCSNCAQKELYSHFVPEISKAKVLKQSKLKTPKSKILQKGFRLYTPNRGKMRKKIENFGGCVRI